MKKKLFYLCAVICTAGFLFSCSKDEGPGTPPPIDTELAGEYKGLLNISSGGSPLGKDIPQKISITKVDANNIKLELKDFVFSTLTLGSITIDKCEVKSDKNDKYSFKGSQTLNLTNLPGCAINVVGIIGGNKINAEITVNAPGVGIIDVSFAGYESDKLSEYSFEDWVQEGMYDDIFQAKGWASCNDAVGLIKNMGSINTPPIVYEGNYPVIATEDAYAGKFAAQLTSVDTKGGILFEQNVPRVTAGSMFLGKFEAMKAVVDPMTTTSFGIMYTKKPISVKGFYKYKPGTDFYNAEGVKTDDKDKYAITAVLYEVDSEEETLDGKTIYTSPKIVAQASQSDGAESTEYDNFDLTLTYLKTYDPNKKYKFTVIFSASADGANYNAAIGSQLTVDEVMIINE